MTSGTNSIGPSPTGNIGANTFAFRKTWTGGDGKKETTPAGKKRSKWNNFTMTKITKQTGSSISFKGNYKLGAGDPLSPFDVAVSQTVPPPGSELTWNPADEYKLQSRLLDKVKGHSFNLAVSTAEAARTVDLVTGTLKTLTRSFLAIKHGDFSSAARWLGTYPPSAKEVRALKTQDLAGRWLEMQYGWKPLVSDVFEGTKAFHAMTSSERTSSVRASNWIGRDTESSESLRVYSAKGRRKLKKAITYEMSEVMTAQRQLGLLDPLSVAWELLPYSFVVDWFIPIGSYLDNLSQIPFLQGRFLTSTSDEWKGFSFMFSPDKNWPAPLGSPLNPAKFLNPNSVPGVKGNYLKVIREVGTSLSVPRPASFDKKGLSGTRVWNAIALAHTAFIGRKSARTLSRQYLFNQHSSTVSD